ncbi:MAG: SDR family NAD(P)-dependent oxidoreductase [Planctomycetaceae bacterium]|jgi:acyl transferase domain-containing protein/NAD(P)-dependent dehydrogenase (short-subunit alcohol dehydrogenase family)|nr:SDR family NAD(P)-dependent oxidoreductase [Planctomycetaceae bacterium]
MENFADTNQLPDGNLSLAIVGMACRLPKADNINAYWNLILRGSYAITEIPPNRFDREIYFDKQKGVKGKSYITHSGLVDYGNFDPLEFPFPSRLIGICDTGSLEMCRVAATACREAGMNPFDIPYRNTGVYLGSTSVGQLYHEINYSTLSPKLARILPELESLQKKLSKDELDKIVSEIILTVRNNSICQPKNGYKFPKVQSMSAAVSESLGLTGISITLDAACSSSLNALAMARRDLRAGLIDMAIVGGGNYFTCESTILFSNAQSGSPDGSFPFTDLANGVIVSEGYAAVVVKTLERALADSDKIHAIIHGIGLSSDGRGRSHWAPRVEGESAAIRKAYQNQSDLKRLAYYEAHATSTPIGDKVELDAIKTVFANELPERIPIGSVKGNIGHPLEAAGIAGLIKTVLIFQHNTIPPQVCPKPLNKNVDWDKLPFYVPEVAAELPASKDGRPRLAGVSAFGVGGINAHVVIQETPDFDRQNYRYKNSVAQNENYSAGIFVAQIPQTNLPAKKISNEPIAVIGVGSLFAGSLNFSEFEKLVKSGVESLTSIPVVGRWSENDYCANNTSNTNSTNNADSYRTRIRRGGFVNGFDYDWKRHKIPPKQISTGNLLQFMILEVVDAALASAGFIVTKNKLDSERTGVIVGSNFSNDFLADLSLSYKLAPFRQLVIDTLKQHGISDPKILGEVEKEYTDKFFERITPLLDEAGGFTASSLASRITKVFDLTGGCATIDAGSASALAAISQAVGMLRENENDLVICAAGSSNMSPVAFICYEKSHTSCSDKIVPAEGAAVLIMKRLSDVKSKKFDNEKFDNENVGNENIDNEKGENKVDEEGGKILFLIHGVGAGFDADIEAAYSKAIEQARISSGLSNEQLARITNIGIAANEIQNNELSYKILKSFYPDAEFSNIAVQIGDAQAASGMASLISEFIVTNNPERNKKDMYSKDMYSNFCAVSASDISGIVYHILIECVPAKITKKPEIQTNSFINETVESDNGIIVTKNNIKEIEVSEIEKSVESLDGNYKLIRFAANSINELRLKLESRSVCAGFETNDSYRIIFITDSETDLSEQISYSLQHLDDNHAEKILLRKNIIFGKRQTVTGKIAFLFSGQGSQYEGMLKPLISGSKIVASIADEFDLELKNAGLPSFSELAWGNRAELGVDVLWTQISLFTADLILFKTAKKFGIVPDIVAGHSYGEYPAITAAGGWTTEQGISATKIRCNAITNSNGTNSNGIKPEDENANNGGRMLAAQMDEQTANDFCNEMSAAGIIIFAANLNSPKQTVLGANNADIQKAYSILNERKIPSVILAVPRPFHTPLMDAIREPLNAALDQVPTGEFSLQFFSSVSNRLETAWNRIHKNLANQLVRPVRFVGLIEELLKKGCSALIECGAGNVLTGLNQKIITEYLAKNPDTAKPICVSLDVKETDRNKKNAGELQLMIVRGMLEIAGHFDSEQKIIADKNNSIADENNSIADEKTGEILTNETDAKTNAKTDADIIVTENIRRKLRRQADFFDPDNTAKNLPDEPIPQFIIELAKRAAVCPESLFAYWKSHPDDSEIFVTKNTNAENNQHDQTTQPTTYNNNLPLLSQDEYLQILNANYEEPPENLRRNSTRFVPRLVSVPLVKSERLPLPVSGRVLIIGDSPIGIALERLLRVEGIDVVSIRCNVNIEELISKVDEVCRAMPVPHCFVVPSREEWNSYHAENSEQSIGQWNIINWKQNRDRRVLNPFTAVQHWYRELALNKELFAKGSIFVTTFLGGSSGFAINVTKNTIPRTNDICGGTLTGLTKSIFLEAGLATQFKFRAVNIDLPASISSKQGAEILLDEWIYGGVNGEIAYLGTERHHVWNVPDYLSYKNNTSTPTTTYTKLESTSNSHQTIKVKPQGAWIVTGGARGITAFTARKLAKDFGVKLNLIGSSPLPLVPDEWIGLDAEAKKILQKDVMIKAKQNGLNPISEWNTTERKIDLIESLKQFDNEGVSYDYYNCDVTDPVKLELTLETIRRKYGAISGVLHGAGLDFSAAFQKKDLQRVERTCAVKVDAAASLMFLLRNDPLKHFLAFGSCSGRIGSVGQTDYALANDALAKLIAAYSQLKPHCRSICFAWGPWDEIGMAVKSGVKDSVALKGVLKIPPEDAYKFILDELELNTPDNEVLICDWKIFIPRFDAIRKELSGTIIETKNQTDENKDNKTVEKNVNEIRQFDNVTNNTDKVTVHSDSSGTINVTINIPPEQIDFDSNKQQDQNTVVKTPENQNRSDRTMKRMIVRMTARPKNNIRNENNWDAPQFNFSNRALIYGDNPDAWVLAEQLLDRGVKTTILPEFDDDNIAVEKLRGFSVDDFPLHLFIMSPRNPLALFDPLKSSEFVEHWHRRRLVGIDIPTTLLREWLKIVVQSGKIAQSSVAAAVSLGGDFGFGDAIESQSGMMGLEGGLIAGLLKGLYAEFGGEKRDRLIVRIIDAPINESPIKISETIINELGNGNSGDRYGIESSVINGQIMTPRIIESEFEPAQNQLARNKITSGGVWIVTGGARGITAENVKFIAAHYKLKIHILGRQPLPEIDESLRYLNDEELKPYKNQLTRDALKNRILPSKLLEEFSRKLEADRNLHAMRELEINVTYHQCDITDNAQVAEVIDKIHKSDGKISGLIHGAGNAHTQVPFLKKNPKDFCNEKSTVAEKFDAAVLFMQLLKDDPIEAFILFSSISGRFGVKYDLAYSAANDAMSKLPRFYRRIQPQSHSVAIHWHSWNDVGAMMLPLNYGAREIQKMNLLKPKEGTERLFEELESGNEYEVIISDDEYYRDIYSLDLKLKLSELCLPLGDKIESDQIETVWNPAAEVLISDHRLADKPILPAALMIESIVEAGMIFAERYSGSGIIVTKNPALLRNFDIAEGLRFFTDTPLTMRTAVNNFSDNKNQIKISCRLLSTFANSKGVVLNPNRFHAGADVLIYANYESIPADLRNRLSELLTKATASNGKKIIRNPIQYVQRGSRMYHGQTLQELQWIAINGSEITGESITQPITKIVGNRSDENWITHPASIDSCLYLCGTATWNITGGVGLPKSIGEILLLRKPKDGEKTKIYVNQTDRNNNVIKYDFIQIGEDNTPICFCKDYNCRLLM